MTQIKVLIVDDSKLVRQLLTEILTQYPQIDVVGAAKDPFEAREMIKEFKPDVLTLDVEMPRMDGLTFLKNLMRLHPLPVVMLSTLTSQGADTTLQALELGAVDFIAKPKSEQLMGNLCAFNLALFNKVKFAASVDVRAIKHRGAGDRGAGTATTIKYSTQTCPHTIIAMGASTGGTEALRNVLIKMPANAPAIVITQHIPESFSKRFAQRLNSQCKMTVHQASHGQQIEPGHVYVAPGGIHLKVRYSGARYICELCDDAPVNRHKPSVDVMFDSLAELREAKVFSVLLTGMGSDGAQGMLALKDRGHYTLIQDKNSCLIWGMPRSALELNAHCDQSPLENVAQTLLNNISQKWQVRQGVVANSTKRTNCLRA